MTGIQREVLEVLAATGHRMSAVVICETAQTLTGRPLTRRIGELNRVCKDLVTAGLAQATRPRHPDSGRRLARRFKITDAGLEHLRTTPPPSGQEATA